MDEKLTDSEKLEILIKKLRKYNYNLDEKERYHLMNLIRRGIVKVDPPKDLNIRTLKEFEETDDK